MQHATRLLAIFTPGAGPRGGIVLREFQIRKWDFYLFKKGYYYPCSERLSVVHFNFRGLSNPLLSNDIGRNPRIGINKPLLGRIKSTKNVRCATGSRLLGMMWTSLLRHQNIAEFGRSSWNFSAFD